MLIALFLAFYTGQQYNVAQHKIPLYITLRDAISTTIDNEKMKTCVFQLQAVVFLALTAHFFHYAIAIALSTSDDTVNPSARQPVSVRAYNP